MQGAAGTAPLEVSLDVSVTQRQPEGFLLPPARGSTMPPAPCLLPCLGLGLRGFVRLFLEIAGGAGLLDDARAGEDGQDAVGHLHLPAGTDHVDIVGLLLHALVSPPCQSLYICKPSMWFEVVLSNNEFVSELFVTLKPLGVQVFVCKFVKLLKLWAQGFRQV